MGIAFWFAAMSERAAGYAAIADVYSGQANDRDGREPDGRVQIHDRMNLAELRHLQPSGCKLYRDSAHSQPHTLIYFVSKPCRANSHNC